MLSKAKRYLLLPLLFVFVTGITPVTLFSGCEIKGCKPKPPEVFQACGPSTQPLNLKMWYMFEKPEVMQSLAGQFKTRYPQVTVTPSRKDSQEKYLQELGVASGTEQAPDIFIIRNDWLPIYKGKLAPIPEVILQRQPDASQAVGDYLKLFLPALETDMVVNKTLVNRSTGETKSVQELYGIPWGQEGMALFVNLNHFNEYNASHSNTQLTLPASTKTMTWAQFRNAATSLVKYPNSWLQVPENANATITIDHSKVQRYGAALGYGEAGREQNVRHAPDIFMTMLQQGGIPIVGEDRETVQFTEGQYIQKAADKLRLYSDFHNSWGTTAYGWTDSLGAFNAGLVSMVFLQSWEMGGVSSSVKFEVVPFPQEDDNTNNWVTPAYYWTRVVNRTSDQVHINCAWEFVKFVASAEQMKSYSEASKIPPARLDLVGENKVNMGDYKYDVFTNAVPYSQSWYKGNFEAANLAVNETLNAVAIDRIDQQTALTDLAKKLGDILQANPLPD